ncbi:MAG: zf-HC2 domain-containing protein, partial [Armatimonadota bacterium]|nr:zf-HC2 domain-containing protein [Armatimonadota bacterium]
MTCDAIQSHITALLDGELTPETASEIECHLAACPECAQARADLEAARELAASWSVDAPDITERVMQAVALDDQSLLLDEMKQLRAEMQGL